MIDYTVIIAERNEPDLIATVGNIKATNNPSAVIVKSDYKGKGPQRMRHEAIEESETDVVIVVDGHMRFQPGMLDAMASYIARKPSTVACAQCFHHYDETWTGQPYSGARFAWTDYGKDASEPQAFTAKWRKDHTPGQIPCIMGACYGFSATWYLDVLRSPWYWGTGWGCDEEILSAATWLMGGTVELLPYAVWHRARKPGQVPYKLSQDQLRGVWSNRLRVIEMLPMSEDERVELVRHIMPALHISEWHKVEEIDAGGLDQIRTYRELYSTGPMKWAHFKQHIAGVETVKEYSMKELRAMARERGVKMPHGCNKQQLAQLLQDGTGFEAKAEPLPVVEPKKKRITRGNWHAGEHNADGFQGCPSCHSGSSRIYSTIPFPTHFRRYRECADCGKKYCTKVFKKK